MGGHYSAEMGKKYTGAMQETQHAPTTHEVSQHLAYLFNSSDNVRAVPALFQSLNQGMFGA